MRQANIKAKRFSLPGVWQGKQGRAGRVQGGQGKAGQVRVGGRWKRITGKALWARGGQLAGHDEHGKAEQGRASQSARQSGTS